MIGYDFIFYVPISLVFVWLGYKKVKKEDLPKWYWLTFLCGLTYINCAIDKLFFPIFYDVQDVIDIKNYINLDMDFSKMMVSQIFYNVLVTVPLAICLLFVFRSKVKNVIISTILCSVSIEIVQLIIILIIKPANVYFDIMDIFLNLLGGIIGCILLIVAKKIASFINMNGFMGYVADAFRKE